MRSDELENASPADHQSAWESLPWYVNGTLDGSELKQLERHTRGCVACRAELKYLRQLGGLLHTAEELPPMPDQSLSAMMARIDAAESGEEEPSLTRRIRSWLEPLYRASPRIRFALMAQAAAILLLVGFLAWTTARQPVAIHRTLSDIESLPADSRANLRVVFVADARESRIREILGSIRGEIVSGPTPLGVCFPFKTAVSPP